MPRYRSFAPYPITPREAPVEHGEVVELTEAEAEAEPRDHLVLLDDPAPVTPSVPMPATTPALAPIATPAAPAAVPPADTKETPA